MANDERLKIDAPHRVPLLLEFHYEVDDRGEHYRVWAEQRQESVNMGRGTSGAERHANP